MVKKLGFNSLLFKLMDAPRKHSCYSSSPSPSPSITSSSAASSWAWPSCTHPKTASFRDASADAAVYKTVNSVYFDSNESCFTRSTTEEEEGEEHEIFSSASEDAADSAAETLIRRLRSDRLFFEPGDTSSILDDPSKPQPQPQLPASPPEADPAAAPFQDSVVMAMESEDPYGDFRRSMEEMVAAHGIKNWEQLEELLVWYLKVNGKATHGLIVGAFVDLLIGLSSASPSPPLSSAASSNSQSSSSSNSFKIEEMKEEEISRLVNYN